MFRTGYEDDFYVANRWNTVSIFDDLNKGNDSFRRQNARDMQMFYVKGTQC